MNASQEALLGFFVIGLVSIWELLSRTVQTKIR